MTLTTSPLTTPSPAPAAFRKLVLARGDQDPFPLYAELRERAPVLHSNLPGSLGGYVLSRYAECSAALRSRCLAPVGTEHIGRLVPDWEERPAARYLYRSLLFQNNPHHSRTRRALTGYFNRSRVQDLRQFMVRTTEELLDSLMSRGANGRTVDLVENLTLPYPLAVIGTLLGIDASSVTTRLGWSGRALSSFLEPLQTPSRRNRIDHAARQLIDFFAGSIANRTSQPADDLVSALVSAWRAGELSQPELVGNLLFLFIAGFDSSTSFLGSAIRILLDHPEQAAMVRDDPSLVEQAVLELLRYAPPVHATSRIAVAPVRLGGVEIPEGSLVWILLASANHDPELTEHPERFDVLRQTPPNLAFAAGQHTCVGGPLARAEAEVLLPLLLRRFPHMALAGPPRHRSPGTVLRGIDHLPVVLTA